MSLYPVLFCIYPTPSGVILAQGLTGIMNFPIFSLLPIVTVATLISLQGYAFWVLSSENMEKVKLWGGGENTGKKDKSYLHCQPLEIISCAWFREVLQV